MLKLKRERVEKIILRFAVLPFSEVRSLAVYYHMLSSLGAGYFKRFCESKAEKDVHFRLLRTLFITAIGDHERSTMR